MTAVTTALPPRGTAGKAWWSQALVAAPTRLPLVVFWTALVVAMAVLLGLFLPIVVLPALVAVLVLTWRLVPERVDVNRRTVLGGGAALTLAAVWLLVNLPFASEVLLVQRDAGFLTLQAIWLSEHAQATIPLGGAPEMAALVDSARVGSDAFWADDSHLYAQGAKTVPGLFAVLGWAAGIPGILAANLLLGAIGLLAVYDVARRLIDPIWGLLPVLALALSTPLLYFTRTAFTEPTNIILTFGGLALLWITSTSPPLWRFALGGAMLGANALGRIDGAAVTAGMALGIGAVAAGSRDPGRRSRWVQGLAVAVGAALVMVLMGYLDLVRNSPAYLEAHASLYVKLIALLVACLGTAVAMIWLTRGTALRTRVARSRDRLGWLAAAGVVGLGLVLASRPLWMQAHWFEGRPDYMAFIAAFQAVAGVQVDGSRSYDEMTLVWLSWYLGPLTVVLAVWGTAVLLREAIVRRRPAPLVLLATLGVPSLVYVVQPAITPDQIWAMRRFLPVVMPATLLTASWLLHRTLTGPAGPRTRIGAQVAAALLVLAPVATWGRLVSTVEYDGRAQQVAMLCEVAAGRPVVVVRMDDPPVLPTVRAACGSEAIEVARRPTPAELAAVRRWAGQDVLVASISDDQPPFSAAEVARWETPMTRWPNSLNPTWRPLRFTSVLWMGVAGEDGRVSPVESAGM